MQPVHGDAGGRDLDDLRYPVTVTLSRTDLTELTAKYAEMLRLRRADGTSTSSGAMKAAMARLATEFPGALRELDDFPLELLESRHAALERAAHADGVEPWMSACVAFHRLARGALSAKRWLGGRKDVDETTASDFANAAGELAFSEDALAWKNELAAIAHPPRGRISQLVLQRVASALGVSTGEARTLIFGPSRRSPRETWL
ncbi:hypothetical protein LVJ94_23005 [Pendulispora rubella]|uniref:Uncharacterized protein n=1 Tax=Pendulispora rubella TaxID=2741070 RepID=A0ABZ2LGL4_9BACT